jgi:hypothetical protein
LAHCFIITLRPYKIILLVENAHYRFTLTEAGTRQILIDHFVLVCGQKTAAQARARAMNGAK